MQRVTEKINKSTSHFINRSQRNYTCMHSQIEIHDPGGTIPVHLQPIPTFFRSKKRKQTKKRKNFKVDILKCCHHAQNGIVLTILERLEFKIFSCRSTMVTDNTFHGPSTLKSISSSLN